MSTIKVCLVCGSTYMRSVSDSNGNWNRRKFCTDRCATVQMMAEAKKRKPDQAASAARDLPRGQTGALVPGHDLTWGAMMPGLKWADALREISGMGVR